VVHVQHAEERTYYSLERLWKDCPLIELPESVTNGRSERPAGAAPVAGGEAEDHGFVDAGEADDADGIDEDDEYGEFEDDPAGGPAE
jgi:ribosome-associated protein